ncbi:conserved hypothetical protein [Rhodospirillaceae bacterium LM-1]|nr:conserved hypothetical protein [Rhodospirillaceae bacterium LM-1]
MNSSILQGQGSVVLMPVWTLKSCFEHFGAKQKNQRWSWSGRSDDGAIVVVTLWKDILKVSNGVAEYDAFGHDAEKWIDKVGNRERLDNLKWALSHCDGIFRGIITVARDTETRPREIQECFPYQARMKIHALNEATGEFKACSISV